MQSRFRVNKHDLFGHCNGHNNDKEVTEEEVVSALVVEESGSNKEEEVNASVVVESDNNMEEEVSALVVVEMSRCSCLLMFEMAR